MHANEMQTSKSHAVGRRRRPRRRHFRRPGILSTCLFLTLTILFAVSLLEGCASSNVPGFSETLPAFSTGPADTQAPQITGIRDIEVYAGETVAYSEGIAVTDDEDPAPELEIDSSGVNLSTPGTYTVHYRATDASGNQTTADATVTVVEKPESFVDTQVIYDTVDAILAQFITDGMTQQEQVEAIYAWTKDNLKYSGHSDRTDWQQTAYTMLTTGEGDCYGYFSATKLMFERLDILNVDVQKKKRSDSDSDHFWSLVSVDGGETYYHFDATPRVGQTEELCLVTDLFLDSFDTYHDSCHNRDKSLYPATPGGWS